VKEVRFSFQQKQQQQAAATFYLLSKEKGFCSRSSGKFVSTGYCQLLSAHAANA
jgi:hypothetical protein